MKTLFVAYRVTDLERSLDFYTALGYRELGRVAFDDGGRLAVLSFPDEPVATLELVHRPGTGPVDVGGFDHLAIQVDDLTSTLRVLTRNGLEPGPPESPGGPDGPAADFNDEPS
ncbi:MAG TPA: VOC family protein [Actinomycetales bacterium]|nr:VOC family protein [Actinomycetales bacterium]